MDIASAPAHTYVLYGNDDFSRKVFLDDLRRQLGMPEVVDANTTVLKGQGLTLELVRDACSAMPFLADRRLVMVEGLLRQHDEPQGTRGRGRASRQAREGLVQWEGLGAVVASLPPTTLLVFLEERLQKSNPLFQAIKGAVQVVEFAMPQGDALRRWIQRRAGEAGIALSPGAIGLLMDFVGGDLWALSGELDKLALYAGDRTVEERDVEALVARTREASIFQAVDAALVGQPGRAMRLFASLRQDATASYVVIMLARQLRFVLVAQDLLRQGVPGKELGKRLGLADFATRTVQEQARRHPAERVASMYRLLLEADMAMKTGELEDQLALETLVAELARSPTRGASR